jgi:hypothetical protein
VTTQLQLEPAEGLSVGLTLVGQSSRQEYRVVAVTGDIVTIAPELGYLEPKPWLPATSPNVLSDTAFRRAERFDPFGPAARNRQEHLLYLGSDHTLDIEAAAQIEIVNGAALEGAEWHYWGKSETNPQPGWVRLFPLDAPGRLVLNKKKGAVDKTNVAGRNSRWLRASRPAGSVTSSLKTPALRLLVNCDPATRPEVGIEGIAVTQPVVLDQQFYPMGRDPRLFDAFYIGSKEAFSKSGASATLTFTMDALAAPMSAAAAHHNAPEYLVVGLGLDGALHRYTVTPGAVEKVKFESTRPDVKGQPLSLTGSSRPGIGHDGVGVCVTVSVAGEVWLWKEANKAWFSLGTPPLGDAPIVGDTVVLKRAGALCVYALVADAKTAQNALFRRELVGGNWERVRTVPQGDAPILMRIAPVQLLRADAANDPSIGEYGDIEGLVGITSDGRLLYGGELRSSQPWLGLGAGTVDTAVYPLAALLDKQLRVFGKVASQNTLVAVEQDLGSGMPTSKQELPLGAEETWIGRAFSYVRQTDRVVAVSSIKQRTDTLAVLWDAFGGGQDTRSEPLTHPVLSDGPVKLDEMLLFPCRDGELALIPIEGERQALLSVTLSPAILLAANDLPIDTPWVVFNSTSGASSDVTPLKLESRETALLTDTGFELELGDGADVFVLPADKLSGELSFGNSLLADSKDPLPDVGTRVLIENEQLRRVTSVAEVGTPDDPFILLEDHLDDLNGLVSYRYAQHTEHVTTPKKVTSVQVKTSSPGLSDLLRSHELYFAEPERAVRMKLEANPIAPQLRGVIESDWTAPVDVEVELLASLLQFQTVEPTRNANPALSWEYWDGSAWWRIPKLSDSTINLVKSGEITFCVPRELKETNVAGRSNLWIRARLVGGDYGQERVFMDGGGEVKRDRSNIHAPVVLKLVATYGVCCEAKPELVLTIDGGQLRDQSNANALGVNVEQFVPLGAALARYAGPGAAEPSSGGAALYLGFDAPISGTPIGILFLLDDAEHEAAFPLRVEALVNGRFQPVVSEDGTRGLSETGILSVALPEAPELSSLFGQTAAWLRLRPSATLADAAFRPQIRGAFVNAVWAHAAETQRLEIVGSSDGSPNQSFGLARPPVLARSLELRVLEDLIDEEVTALRKGDPERVLTRLGERVGYWVRWEETPDLQGRGNERVYSLDAETGRLWFGDGRHGKIPAIGRDVLVAARYERAGGAAANAVAPWSDLSLTTPLQGVQGVAVPQGAAGGSDPQTAEQVLRFAPANLAARGRIVNLADLEAMALQFSPSIGQVRAHGSGGKTRLIVALRGREPTPHRNMLRELKSVLLAAAPPMLSKLGALSVEAPRVVELRIRVGVTVASLDHSGQVAADIASALHALLDAGSGGRDAAGFPLGVALSEVDVAAQVSAVEHIESVDTVDINVVDDSGALTPLATTFRFNQLAQLLADGVVVDCALPPLEERA